MTNPIYEVAWLSPTIANSIGDVSPVTLWTEIHRFIKACTDTEGHRVYDIFQRLSFECRRVETLDPWLVAVNFLCYCALRDGGTTLTHYGKTSNSTPLTTTSH
jgi:hypothetical protein